MAEEIALDDVEDDEPGLECSWLELAWLDISRLESLWLADDTPSELTCDENACDEDTKDALESALADDGGDSSEEEDDGSPVEDEDAENWELETITPAVLDWIEDTPASLAELASTGKELEVAAGEDSLPIIEEADDDSGGTLAIEEDIAPG